MASWKSLTSVPSFTPDTMLLMTDATVLVHDSYGQDWYRLKPDNNGEYDSIGAVWSGPFSMLNSRQFFASGVLADGRVYVVGGEYFNGSPTPNDSPLGEIFDPQTNKWSTLNKPASFSWVQGDANSCILQNGRVIFGSLSTNQSAIWDPAIDAWTEAGTAFGTLSPTKVGTSDEETWTLLPNGTVLTVTIASPPFAEKYVPETDTWVPANPMPVELALLSLPDTTVNPPVPVNIGEIGPAILLPDQLTTRRWRRIILSLSSPTPAPRSLTFAPSISPPSQWPQALPFTAPWLRSLHRRPREAIRFKSSQMVSRPIRSPFRLCPRLPLSPSTSRTI